MAKKMKFNDLLENVIYADFKNKLYIPENSFNFFKKEVKNLKKKLKEFSKINLDDDWEQNELIFKNFKYDYYKILHLFEKNMFDYLKREHGIAVPEDLENIKFSESMSILFKNIKKIGKYSIIVKDIFFINKFMEKIEKKYGIKFYQVDF